MNTEKVKSIIIYQDGKVSFPKVIDIEITIEEAKSRTYKQIKLRID